MRHITVIHPSRGRAELCAKTVNSIFENAVDYEDNNNIKYFVCIEPDQEKEYLPALYDTYFKYDVRPISQKSNSAIAAINMCFNHYKPLRIDDFFAEHLDIILVMSDDFVLPKGWDMMIREAVADKTDFVLKTFDGTQKWICTLPIMDKVYYDRLGYVYNPGYKHMFADTELTHVAELLGKLIVRNDIVFPHRTEVTGNDAINKKNNATWEQGEALYLQRVKENFGLPEELRKPVSYKPHQQWINQKLGLR